MGQVEDQAINWGKNDITVFLHDILSSSGWLYFIVIFFFSERFPLKILDVIFDIKSRLIFYLIIL